MGSAITSVASVASVDEECCIMGRCVCGGDWRLAFNAVTPVHGDWVDSVRVRCQACGAMASFAFEISRFFEPRPGIWAGALVPRRRRTGISRIGRVQHASAQVRAMA